MSKTMGERAASAFCLAVVIASLLWIDVRVRERFFGFVAEASDGGINPWGSRLGEVGHALARSAQEQSLSNAPLLVFTVVALVLVLFMLRS
ncbi:MAG: hypothetical protein HYX76_16310 [Acidobacteria bacterium]|nr:hypothetical protein [Acidobacteriota bacterium]